MNDPAAPHPVTPPIGLAVASLALGIVGIFTSFLLIGLLAALLGLILGWAHLARHQAGRGMALWGLALSVVGLILGGTFAGVYYHGYRSFTQARERAGDREDVFAEWKHVPAPDLSFTTLDGRAIKLSELKGRRVVLDFWATWCPPCRKEIPHFVQLAGEHPETDLIIIGISNEDAAKLKGFAEQNGVNYPMASVSDDDLPAPYNLITGIPTTFFIDRQGVICDIEVGYHPYEALRELAVADDCAGEVKPAPAAAP